MIEFPIKHKLSNQIQFTAKINCDESTPYSQKLGLAVKWAIENNVCHLSNANLEGAYLIDAYLKGANLRGANLIDAYLKGANLRDANLTCTYLNGADLRGANLMDANLNGANLNGTNLNGAYLRGANLRCAYLNGTNLEGANLEGVNLEGAYLTRVNLKGANLMGAYLQDALSEEQLINYKHDFWGILLQYRNEIESLREHILAGKINGSVYSGECACLMGTIANIKSCEVDELEKDHLSYIESWFTMIKEGDTPENNYASEMTLKWLDEFVSLTK